MSTIFALELNDAGLQLARATDGGPAELLGDESPGVAVLLDGRVVLGREAALRQRVTPLHAQNRFWYELGLEPLPWSARGVATQADLAHAQLTQVLAAAQPATDAALIIATPPGYTREQLGLLVGIASETGLPLRGLVDLGLAACVMQTAARHVLHLDLQLHQAAITAFELAPGDGLLRRTRYELQRGAGVLAFQQALAAAIASEFVRQTRFDPLHQAATEQRLHDSLPGWLVEIARGGEVAAEIPFGTASHRATLTAAQLSGAIEALANEVQRLVQAARPAGLAVQLCVSHRIAALPGLSARLAALRDCHMVELRGGAAALGALAARDSILRPQDAIALVHRLPPATAAAGLAPEAATEVDIPTEAVPTHVLFRGRAWPVTAEPLTLGWSVATAARILSLPAGIAGLSKSHCTLVRRNGQALVEDHSTYGTFVNDERVAGHVALRVGDVLRLGAPGVSLELIRVLPEHGTA
jgi:hypothetical protein